jgi:hypothetical protein
LGFSSALRRPRDRSPLLICSGPSIPVGCDGDGTFQRPWASGLVYFRPRVSCFASATTRARFQSSPAAAACLYPSVINQSVSVAPERPRLGEETLAAVVRRRIESDPCQSLPFRSHLVCHFVKSLFLWHQISGMCFAAFFAFPTSFSLDLVVLRDVVRVCPLARINDAVMLRYLPGRPPLRWLPDDTIILLRSMGFGNFCFSFFHSLPFSVACVVQLFLEGMHPVVVRREMILQMPKLSYHSSNAVAMFVNSVS